MNTGTSNAKYQLLVLTDLTKASDNTLMNAAQLAKVIGGNVEVFHAKAPTDVVKQENQLSAMRTIHKDYNSSKKKLESLKRSIEQKAGIPISYAIGYGNIKTTIKERIDFLKPDIVVLGKRKPKWDNFLREGITEFLLKNSDVNLLIGGDDKKFHSFTDISLGVYGQDVLDDGFEIISELREKNQKPVKMFSMGKSKNAQKSEEHTSAESKMVSYVFSENDNAFGGLISYVSKTNTQLLCIPGPKNSRKNFSRAKGNQIGKMVQKLDIPVLITR